MQRDRVVARQGITGQLAIGPAQRRRPPAGIVHALQTGNRIPPGRGIGKACGAPQAGDVVHNHIIVTSTEGLLIDVPFHSAAFDFEQVTPIFVIVKSDPFRCGFHPARSVDPLQDTLHPGRRGVVAEFILIRETEDIAPPHEHPDIGIIIQIRVFLNPAGIQPGDPLPDGAVERDVGIIKERDRPGIEIRCGGSTQKEGQVAADHVHEGRTGTADPADRAQRLGRRGRADIGAGGSDRIGSGRIVVAPPRRPDDAPGENRARRGTGNAGRGYRHRPPGRRTVWCWRDPCQVDLWCGGARIIGGRQRRLADQAGSGRRLAGDFRDDLQHALPQDILTTFDCQTELPRIGSIDHHITAGLQDEEIRIRVAVCIGDAFGDPCNHLTFVIRIDIGSQSQLRGCAPNTQIVV